MTERFSNDVNDLAENNNAEYEEYDASGALRTRLLMSQLAVVDRAIEKVVKHSVSPHQVQAVDVTVASQNEDRSYKIDTSSKQLATCPLCLAELDAKRLKSHIANSCLNKLVRCPEPNCRSGQMPLRDLKMHLANECTVVRHRRELVEDARLRKERERQEEQAKRELLLLLEREKQRAAAEAATTIAPSGSTPQPLNATPASVKPTTVHCPQCEEIMNESRLSHHLRNECPRRLVMCPNFYTGCKQRLVPIETLNEHLRNECATELLRERMIARSAKRREKVQCPACGKMIPLLHLRRHEEELCKNRLVHCRNHDLGCQVMVRRGERHLHEYVDGSRQQRTALYFNSHGSHLAVLETDISCPWTAEYWLYRPRSEESAKNHILNIFLLLPKYIAAFVAESCVKNRVLEIVNCLKESKGSKKSKSLATESDTEERNTPQLTKEERALKKREDAEARISMVNELTQLVSVYSDAVLHYIRAFQAIAVSIEACYSCMDDIVALQVQDERTVSNLLVEYPGDEAKKPELDLSFAMQSLRPKATTADTAISDQHPTVDVEGSEEESASTRSYIHDEENVQLQSEVVDGKDGDYDEVAKAESTVHIDQFMSEMSADAIYGENDDTKSTGNEDEATQSSANQSQSGGEEEASQTSDERMLAVIEEQTRQQLEEIKSWEQKLQMQRPASSGQAVDVFGIATYLHGGNSFAHLMRNCLRLHDLHLLERVDLVAEENTHSTGSTAGVHALPLHEQPLMHPLFKAVPEDVDDDRWQHEQMVDLQQRGITKFLVDILVRPAHAVRNHMLNWQSWKMMVSLLRESLKCDFDWLQRWRVEAGLLKPDENRGTKKKGKEDGASPTTLNAEQERAMERKEKARKRREMKRQKSQSLQAALAKNAEDTANGKVVDQQQSKGTNKRTEERLISRVGEALKSGCGAGILAESSTQSSESNRSKICVEMWSGMSILFNQLDGNNAEHAEGSDTQGLHYDLLIRERDLAQMIKMRGRFGVVCTNAASDGGEHIGIAVAEDEKIESAEPATSKAAEDEAIGGDALDADGVDEVVASNTSIKLGTDARCFDVNIPRGRWTHVVLVATSQPQNRLTLYVDGLMIKQLKDCAFPLPMHTLGGCCQSQSSFESFEGALLDVRYWGARRSGIEVQDFMHRLVELPEAVRASDGISGAARNKQEQRQQTAGSAALIGWWTFEDGASSQRVADVTGHRYKTPISTRPSAVTFASQQSILEKNSSAAAAADNGACTHGLCSAFTVDDESKCYPIPPEVQKLMPTIFQRLIPISSRGLEADELREGSKAKEEDLDVGNSPATIISRESAPWEMLLREISYSCWLDAESIRSGNRKFHHPKGTIKPPPEGKRPGRGIKRPLKQASGTVVSAPGRGVDATPEEILPLPSFRTRNLCPFELRRHRLALKGRALQRLVDCPLECGTQVRAMDVRFHVRHECKERKVVCRFLDCSATFRESERAAHEEFNCDVLKSRAGILQQAKFNRKAFACPLCSESVMLRDQLKHDKEQCPHRLVWCIHDDCSRGKTGGIKLQKLWEATRAKKIALSSLVEEKTSENRQRNSDDSEDESDLESEQSLFDPPPEGPSIPAHRLQYHLQHECDSTEVSERLILIQRARQRVNYPRPWGIPISTPGYLTDVAEELNA